MLNLVNAIRTSSVLGNVKSIWQEIMYVIFFFPPRILCHVLIYGLWVNTRGGNLMTQMLSGAMDGDFSQFIAVEASE